MRTRAQGAPALTRPPGPAQDEAIGHAALVHCKEGMKRYDDCMKAHIAKTGFTFYRVQDEYRKSA